MRGAPRLPVVLYSPLKPVVNIVFINMCDMVSRDALLMSPNLESTVHTFMPVGISLLELSESVAWRDDLRDTFPSASIWLYVPFCAARLAGHANSASSASDDSVFKFMALIA